MTRLTKDGSLKEAMNLINKLDHIDYKTYAISVAGQIARKGWLTDRQMTVLRRMSKSQKLKKKAKLKPNTRNYVYVISDGEYVKFGFSKSPRDRLKDLQVGNPKTLKLVCIIALPNISEARKLESTLHAKFSEQRKHAFRSHCSTFAPRIIV